MLRMSVGGDEYWDEANERFETHDYVTLDFEHSLVSLSKWESKYEKPFLTEDERTPEETIDYLRMMCLTPDVPDEVFEKMNQKNFEELGAYIEKKSTATWFGNESEKKYGRQTTTTTELIYYWMFARNIPKECETWHINRLITLIRVYDANNQEKKKMSPAELAARNRELNARRRAELNTRG